MTSNPPTGFEPRKISRIIDCFTFNNELLLLEFRLDLLDSVVDRFVLVEADTTHQGKPKDLVFLNNRDRFARWGHKITHVVVRDMPSATDAWVLENFQRRAILRGLEGAEPMDIAVVSDADEIPDPTALLKLQEMPLETAVGLAVRTSYFCVDLQEVQPGGWIPKACRVKDLKDPHALRDMPETEVLPDAGWHLAWLYTEIDPSRKLQAFAHAEYSTPWFRSPQHALRCRNLGVDLFGRFILQPVPWDELGEPIREFALAHPRLMHGPRSPWSTFLARCYLTSIWGARLLPVWLTDRHPLLTFVAAATIRVLTFPVRRMRRQLLGNSTPSS